MATYESSRLGDGSAWMQEAWERRVPVKGVNGSQWVLAKRAQATTGVGRLRFSCLF